MGVKSSKECHILFDLSPKIQKTFECDEGSVIIYDEHKSSLHLRVDKYSAEKPENAMEDSLAVWIEDKKLIEETISKDKQPLRVNNVRAHRFTFIENEASTGKKNCVLVFPSNTHLYKMHFSYNTLKTNKCEKEIQKIIESLSLDCH